MTTSSSQIGDGGGDGDVSRARRGGFGAYVRLMRPTHWSKGVFVLLGPMVHVAERGGDAVGIVGAALLAAVGFGFVSSGCYVVNDLLDAEADRAHPRKRRRPIASGEVGGRQALVFAGLLMLCAVLAVVGVVVVRGLDGGVGEGGARVSGLVSGLMVLGLLGLQAGNVSAYSWKLKHVAILDVMSLSMGFVLRVLAGCAAGGIVPTTWLLNCTLFLAMFLAFGKRLGERRTLGEEESAVARAVQAQYSSELLRMAVVVTAVASLLAYAGYIESKDAALDGWFNLWWLTVIPATYGVFRALLLLERGEFDDPTELATHDRPTQLAVVVFGVLVGIAMLWGPVTETVALAV